MTEIGIQGEAGSYTEMAAQQLRPNTSIAYYDTFAALFTALRNGEIDRAVSAIENSHIGPIPEPNAELAARDVYHIVAKIVLPIRYALLAVPQARLQDIRQVHSQRPALEQCREFLQMTLPGYALIEEFDTALAAKIVATAGDIAQAAIASRAAGDRYGLVPLL